MSPAYKSPFGLQNVPASTKHRVESAGHEKSGQSQSMHWEHTGKPVFWSRLEGRSTAGFFPRAPDFPSAFGDPSNNLGYQDHITSEFPTQYSGSPYYISQTQPDDSFANTDNFTNQRNTGIDPEDSLFPTGDFLTTRPQNATEIAFVETLLEYTRAQFRSLMSEEPPKALRS